MRRVSIILVLLALICSGCNLPNQTTPTSGAQTQDTTAPTTQTDSKPTAIPSTPKPLQTSADTIPSASIFPDSNSFTWQLLVSHLQRPVDLKADGSGCLFVIEKLGRIRIIQNGQLSPDAFLDITDRVNSDGNEQGLLGLAFHPDFAQNGFLYVNYTSSGGTTHISRFQANGNSVDPKTELNLLKIKQPFPNHNGGSLVFGPDGYLYAGLGDGGSQGDPNGNAQNLKSLLGKILRIDVNSTQPYAIPADNPFGTEIMFYGLRNPWRISFDMQTGDLYIGDVGQGDWEEIDYVPAGSKGGLNFGWNIYEGNHDYKNNSASGNYTFPVAEYNHADGGCSLIGGYVYRGPNPELNGVYFYGDYCSGKVWGLIHLGDQWQSKLLFETKTQINSFGQDENGELYLLSDDGDVYKLIHK